MIRESRDYLEMTFRAARLFAQDGGLSAEGMQEIINVALRDGVLDNNEIRVLKEIVVRLKPHEITPAMREKLNELSLMLAKYKH